MCSSVKSCCMKNHEKNRQSICSTESIEPLEVRSLKKKLGNVNCYCNACRSKVICSHDVQIQVANTVIDSHPFKIDFGSQVAGTLLNNHPFPVDFSSQKDSPSAHIPPNILRQMLPTPKECTNQSVETDSLEFANKSTSKMLRQVEKSTSLIFKPVLKYANMPRYNSANVLTSTDSICLLRKRTSREKNLCALKCSDEETNTSVDFNYADYSLETLGVGDASEPKIKDVATSDYTDTEGDVSEIEEDEPLCGICKDTPLLFGNCVGVENFINSIRPPLHDLYFVS